jgi:hypothetical protein
LDCCWDSSWIIPSFHMDLVEKIKAQIDRSVGYQW